MSLFGIGSEMGPVPSYFLAEVTAVNAEDQTCSIVLLRGFEVYDNVIVMRDPGVFSLPKVGDLCTVFWDNKNKPIINGVYPVFHKDNKDLNKFYFVQAGERMVQSEFGQKLLMNKRGQIVLTNWLSQGMEVDENTGIVLLQSDTVINNMSGVDVRSGFAKRESVLSKKEASIFSASLGSITQASTNGLSPSLVALGGADKTVVENATIIKNVNSSGKEGATIYENKVGNVVIDEEADELGNVDVIAHTKTGLPLRSLTKYYAEGTSDAVITEVDVNGNVNITIPATASDIDGGFNLEGLFNEMAVHFKSMTIGGVNTETLDLKGTNVSVESTATDITGTDYVDITGDSVTVNSSTANINGNLVALGDGSGKFLVTADMLAVLQLYLSGHVHEIAGVGTTGAALPPFNLTDVTPFVTIKTKAS